MVDMICWLNSKKNVDEAVFPRKIHFLPRYPVRRLYLMHGQVSRYLVGYVDGIKFSYNGDKLPWYAGPEVSLVNVPGQSDNMFYISGDVHFIDRLVIPDCPRFRSYKYIDGDVLMAERSYAKAAASVDFARLQKRPIVGTKPEKTPRTQLMSIRSAYETALKEGITDVIALAKRMQELRPGPSKYGYKLYLKYIKSYQ